MEPRDLFKVGLKLLGMYFVATTAASVFAFSAFALLGGFAASNMMPFGRRDFGQLTALLVPMLQGGLGLILLLATEPIVALCWAPGTRRAAQKYRDQAPPIIQPPPSGNASRDSSDK